MVFHPAREIISPSSDTTIGISPTACTLSDPRKKAKVEKRGGENDDSSGIDY